MLCKNGPHVRKSDEQIIAEQHMPEKPGHVPGFFVSGPGIKAMMQKVAQATIQSRVHASGGQRPPQHFAGH